MNILLIVSYVIFLIILIFLLTRKDDRILELEERVSFLEQKVNKKIVSRLLFIELKSVNSVLDTLNNCFYLIDKDGDYIIDSEYRLSDVNDEWWEKLSEEDIEIVNKIRS